MIASGRERPDVATPGGKRTDAAAPGGGGPDAGKPSCGKPGREKGTVYVNEQVGPGLYIMEIGAPGIAGAIEPGQFVHMRLPDMEAHILRRPFSIYAATPELGLVEILYQAVGFGSRHMTRFGLGDEVDLIGPLGSPWNVPDSAERALLIAGGVGAAPLFMLAGSLVKRGIGVDIVLGAQTRGALVCHDRYRDLLAETMIADSSLRCATDDGSFGHAGFCTALVEEALGNRTYGYAAVCGPESMMKTAAGLVLEAGVPCEVSLERRMACGIGACLSCVVETTGGLKRACVDGPVFSAKEVVFP